MDYSLSFFSADSLNATAKSKYTLLCESAKLADKLGYSAIWLPERHFQTFGGLYSSPSVVGAAVSMLTERIKICAGSVVMPLNDPLRVAEEWAIVDNLSGGRVALAFASGWHVNDFVLAPPGVYEHRHEEMYKNISLIQQLWSGKKISRLNGVGRMIEVGILPRPIQPELQLSLTAASDETFVKAAQLGFNVLTSNFANRTLSILRRRIEKYRETIYNEHGRRGHVAMMVHSFTGSTEEEVLLKARPALFNYLSDNIDLQQEHERYSGLGPIMKLTKAERLEIVETATDQNFNGPLSFIGTLDRCDKQAKILSQEGVDELACLIDFGVGVNDCLMSISRIAKLIGAGSATYTDLKNEEV